MSYFNEQCLQALQGIERNLDRIATMYEKMEKVKMGVLTLNMAFPEYADVFNERQKELEKIFMPKSWMADYELSPKKEPTYADIFERFKVHFPVHAQHVTDYRPANEPNSIIIWLDDVTIPRTATHAIIYNDDKLTIRCVEEDQI